MKDVKAEYIPGSVNPEAPRPRELFCPLARGRCEREACVMYWDNKDPTAKPRCQYFKTEIPRE